MLPLKGVNRCRGSAAGLRAMQDINSESLCQDALGATNTEGAKKPREAVKRLVGFFKLFSRALTLTRASSGPLGRMKIMFFGAKFWIQKRR